MKRTVFFHAGCPDGFGAAWAVWRAWGDDARYVPRGHEDTPAIRGLADQRVVYVDIAPGNDELRTLDELADQVIVLDHHVTAQRRFESEPSLGNELANKGHRIHFDLDHSGAVLAWQHFHPDEPTPDLLRYVEDQDLWNWKLPRSEEVNAVIGAYAREFEVWSELGARSWEELAQEGEPIVRARRCEVQRAVSGAHPVSLGNLRVEAVNSPLHRSYIGHELAKRAAFGTAIGLVYRLSGRRVDVSLYSIGEQDVSAISSEHGGGGHRNAAGFSVALGRWLKHFA